MVSESIKLVGQIAQEVGKRLRKPKLKKLGNFAEKFGSAMIEVAQEKAKKK